MSGLLDKLFGRLDPDEVVRQHGPAVHRHLRRIFGPSADVDDVFQQVFLEILRSLPGFRGEAKLSTWIRRITWNVAYQEMRSRYAHKCLSPIDDLELGDAPGHIEAELEHRESMRRLYAALESVDPKQRLPVIMHDLEGLTLREIGEALGRPLPTVASQLYAGRAALAEQMRERTPAAAVPAKVKVES